MQVIFSPLYAWARSGLGICESLPVPPQKQPFFDSQAQNAKSRWKHVGNHRQNWNRSDTCFRKDVPYNTTHTRESQARKRKKLTERIPVSHTLNLLRNGIILQKGHIIYTGNAKSQILTSKRKSRWNEWGIQTIGKPTAKEGEPSARSWRSEQRVPRQTKGGDYTIAQDCGKVKSLRRASTQSVAFLGTATARQASGVNLYTPDNDARGIASEICLNNGNARNGPVSRDRKARA